MNQRLTRSGALALFVIALAGLVAASPVGLRAEPHYAIADFAPPLSADEARKVVAEAQQQQAAQRAAVARNLEMTSADALPLAQTVFVDQSRYHISDRAGFLSFWRRNGGVQIFGYPISEELVENGRIVQYFERARFEYHADRLGTEYQVQLSLLGSELLHDRQFPAGDPAQGEVFFPETGHTLSGKFRQFWEKRGGLRLFGFPISEPLDEVNPVDGQVYRVQYFERARFEYHPDALDGFYRQMADGRGLRLAGLYEIELGDLGRQMAERQGYSFGGRRQFTGTPVWSPSIWQRRIEVNLSTQRLTAYEGDTPVYSAPVATGKDGFNTPAGDFAIYSKIDRQTMVGNAGGETWNVPNIPWVQYVVGGVALHGTYWHDRWGSGVRMSHGCINLNIDDAQWLYEWADIGTPVSIHY